MFNYFDGGYVSLGNTGTFSLRYFFRDYQGNVRVVADTQGNILQRVNYYPYGVPWNDDIATAGYQAHKYGGKELDLMHGLNLYNFGAREYDLDMKSWSEKGNWPRNIETIIGGIVAGKGTSFDIFFYNQAQLERYIRY